MSDVEKSEEFDVAPVQDFEVPKTDDASNEISELSKKGYQLLKENKTENAIESFRKILDLEENNNYALVGLGDSERKRFHFKHAIEYYSKCKITYRSEDERI